MKESPKTLKGVYKWFSQEIKERIIKEIRGFPMDADRSSGREAVFEGKSIEEEQGDQTEDKKGGVLDRTVASLGIPTFVIDFDHEVVEWNKALENLTGVKKEEVVGTTDAWKGFFEEDQSLLADLIIEEDNLDDYEGVKKAKNTQDGYTSEKRISINGEEKYILFTATPIYGDSGEKEGAVQTVEDITDRRVAEREAGSEEELLDSLLDLTPDMLCFQDEDGRYIKVSKAFADEVGVEREEIIGKTVHDFYPEDMAEEMYEDDMQVIEDGEAVIDRKSKIDGADGETYWQSTTKIPRYDSDGNVIGLIGISRDITERKKAEKEAEFESNILEGLLQSVPDLVYFKDEEARYTRISESFAETLETTREEMRGKTVYDLYPEEEADSMYEDDMNVIENEEPVIGRESHLTKPSGGTYWESTTKIPQYDEDGNVVGMWGISRDVTELKEAEEEAKFHKNLLDALLEHAPDLIYFKNKDHEFVRVGESYADIFGAEEEEMIGKTAREYWPEADSIIEDEKQIMEEEKEVIGREREVTLPNGEKRWYSMHKMPRYDEDGNIMGMFSIDRDITARKTATEEITKVMKALAEGNLSERVKEEMSGDFAEMKKNINETIETLDRIVNEIRAVMDEMAQGNLSNKIEAEIPGAYQEIKKSVNSSIEKLNSTLVRVKESSEVISDTSQDLASAGQQMDTSADQVSEAVQEISEGAQKQAEKVGEGLETSEQVSEVSENVLEQAKEVRERAVEGSDASAMGKKSVRSAVDSMDDIADGVDEAVDAVETLRDRSEEIEKTVDVITDVADQTNILALNAAIEAANAGEHGRGFAVVAEEVRRLAEDTKESADEISEVIEEVVDRVDDAVGVIRSSAEMAEEGKEAAQESLESTRKIEESVEKTLESAQTIVDQSEKQREDVERIVSALEEISSIAEETTAQTEETSSSAEELTASVEDQSSSTQELSSMAEELESLVERFDTQ